MGLGWLLVLAAAGLRGLWLLHGYMNGGSTFPEPLSSEEERKALVAMHQGDATARARLITHNLRLVAHIVKKFDGCGEEVDDLLSIGTIGLIKGVATFNPLRGTRLATYAARCIENEILMHLRAMKKTRGTGGIDAPITHDGEGNELTMADVLPSDEEDILERVARGLTRTRLAEIIRARCCWRERLILALRFGFGGLESHTQREVAQRLNISRSYVSRIEMEPTVAARAPRHGRPGALRRPSAGRGVAVRRGAEWARPPCPTGRVGEGTPRTLAKWANVGGALRPQAAAGPPARAAPSGSPEERVRWQCSENPSSQALRRNRNRASRCLSGCMP